MKTVVPHKLGMFAIGLTAVGLAAFTSVPTLAFGHHDDEDRVHESRDVAPFKNIRIKGGIEMNLVVGKPQSVDVATTADYKDRVKTYVDGDTLVIDMTDDRHNIRLHDDEVEVTINMETLEDFEVLGAVDGTIKGFNGGDLNVEIKGAGDLTIEGSCNRLDLEIKGAGKVDAEDFTCKDVDVAVKGVGSASVHASESVDADIGGIGEITVYGHPKTVRKDSGGLGSIRIR